MNQEQKKPMVARWLWITFVVVVILAVALGIWYFLMGPGKTSDEVVTPTAPAATEEVDETDGWKTYTNSDPVFSLKYPSSQLEEKALTETERNSNILLHLNWKNKLTTPSKTGDVTYQGIFVAAYPNADQLDASQLISKDYPDTEVGPFAKKVTVGGKEGFQMRVTGTVDEYLPDIKYIANLDKNFRIYSFTSEYLGEAGEKQVVEADETALFDEIVATFKFSTDSIQTSSEDSTALIQACLTANASIKAEAGFECAITKKEGNYASGTVSTDNGGFNWYAKKTNEVWAIVANGLQDDPSCTITSDFPKTIVPTCR